MSRHGAANPFYGQKHSSEWKREAAERQFTWTPDDLVTLRRWYVEHDGTFLRLDELALRLGRPKTSVCRMARQLGLTHTSRLTGRKLRAKHATEEARRAAIGEATRRRLAQKGHPRGMLGKKQKPDVVAALSIRSKAQWQNTTPEQRAAITDKQQATLMERYGNLAPGHNSGANPYSRTRYGKRVDLGGQFFRSSWEANYARFLNWLLAAGQIIAWEYEPDTFWFEEIKRGVRSYKPDFRVTELNGAIHYVEVKGWLDAKSQTKIARMALYHPTVELRVVDEKAYREIERKISGAIPGWEKQRPQQVVKRDGNYRVKLTITETQE